MFTQTVDTIIIGGGLSGMYAAYLLSKKNISFVVLEARERIGGRILSLEHHGFFSDLGPSWYWPEINPKMMHLIQTLGLTGYQQFETGMGRFENLNGFVQTVRGYSTSPTSWRLTGGMTALITKLLETIPQAAIILFTPDLSHDLTQAMLRMGTWMAGQAKFYALYEEPYWRQTGLSGQAFSQRWPLGEIHDGSNKGREPYGLTGFINIPAAQRKREQSIAKAILVQLAAIYGNPAAQPMSFYYQDWAREKFTATQFDQPPMREHPVYQPPAGQTAIWDGIIQFAGSETASQHGGYLEGALVSAERAAL